MKLQTGLFSGWDPGKKINKWIHQPFTKDLTHTHTHTHTLHPLLWSITNRSWHLSYAAAESAARKRRKHLSRYLLSLQGLHRASCFLPVSQRSSSISVCQHVFSQKSGSHRGEKKKKLITRRESCLRRKKKKKRHRFDLAVSFHSWANAQNGMRGQQHSSAVKWKPLSLNSSRTLNPLTLNAVITANPLPA